MSKCRLTRYLIPIALQAMAFGPALAGPTAFDRIVAFGTSLSDPGNAFVWLSDPARQACGARLAVPPYDELDELAIPSGPYATGGHHVTNGDTWIESAARTLQLAAYAGPALRSHGSKAANYAVSGARAIDGDGCRFDLPDQVGAYFADAGSTSAGTLVAIEIGSNDVRDALIAGAGGQDPTPYLQNALQGLAYAVLQLYGHGARTFLVPNVPDLGRTPAVRRLDQVLPGAAAGATFLSAAYNAGLAQTLQGLTQALPDVDIKVIDVHGTLEEVVANPADFGFVNTTDACVTPGQPPFRCARPDTFVFWDGVHPTKAFHDIVAQQALLAIVEP